MDVVDALYRLGGAASHRALIAATSRWHVKAAVDHGRIVRLGRGEYALPGIDDAVAEARRLGGLLSHTSAALAHGWGVWRQPQKPWVTVPAGRHVDRQRRRGARVVRQDVAADGMLTAPLQTVLDCARRLPFEEALAVADSALRSSRVTGEELIAAADALPRPGHARTVARHATVLADNPFESVVRAHCLQVAGVDLRPQVEVAGYGRGDLVDVEGALIVECDSFGFHAGRSDLLGDIERHNRAAAVGASLLRFGYEHAHRPEYIVETLEAWGRRPARPHRLLAVEREIAV